MASSAKPTRSPIRLLITARDPATAVSFQKLIPRLQANLHFDILIVAQAPGSDILRQEGLAVEEFFPQDSFERKQKQLEQVFDKVAPDAVLCGISGPDLGVDEATLAVAKQRGIPSYALQSFWGDINQLSGATPDCAFVLDDEATVLTKERYPQIRCIPIGSIKHADFAACDALQIRASKRANYVGEGEVLIGFYGQPILEIDGYFSSIEAMVRQLMSWPRPFKLLYRPHPKESDTLFNQTLKLFRDSLGDRVLVDDQKDIIHSLSVCDLVVSVFSTCGFDNLYLNEISPRPFNTSVYLWFEPAMIEWWRQYSGLTQMPLVEEGLLLSPESEESILEVFEKGLDPQVRQILWQRAKQHLPDASLAVDTLINTLVDDFNADV
ncbi:hypothetical protein [Thiomicrorhabdus sp.]|uniref:hypothetical protein n=1 Tax=Thiomicrorhabdus sp. TaxID=2039724 RepID=UPI0029C8B039|nr:hypothetical protein [Thiomicrorhabdus sp.]